VRTQGAASLLPANADRWPVARGVQLVEGPGGFADGEARVLGWRRSAAYPLVALVALSHTAVLEAADAYWIDSRNHTVVATAVLALLALGASMLSLRAAKRARERAEVQRAYRTATESGNDGFYMIAPVRDRQSQIVDFRIVDCNERGAFFYGSTRAQLVGTLISELHFGNSFEELSANYLTALAVGFHQEDRRMPDNNLLNIRWGHRRIVRVGDNLAVTLQGYMVDLAEASRRHPALLLGLSPRATLQLSRATRARAASQGREYATPDDVKAVAEPVLSHRVMLRPDAMSRGVTGHTVIREIVASVPVPVGR